MKYIMIFFFFFISIDSYSQDWGEYDINFDDEDQLYRITIDTLSNPDNIWQIGPPQKTFFTGAYSLPNVMVTDTINAYPANDTSVFYITHIASQGYSWYHTVIVAGYYKSDCDSLNDHGLIEVSPDLGETWIDLNDPAYDFIFMWDTEKPALTGLVTEWTYFYVNIAELGLIYNVEEGDTIYYRFTFISDDISEERDGLVFDDLHFEDWMEDINEHANNGFLSTAYPNPSASGVTIEFENSNNILFSLIITDLIGKQLFTTIVEEDHYLFERQKFLPGLYLYKLVNQETKQFSQGKFIIRR